MTEGFTCDKCKVFFETYQDFLAQEIRINLSLVGSQFHRTYCRNCANSLYLPLYKFLDDFDKNK